MGRRQRREHGESRSAWDFPGFSTESPMSWANRSVGHEREIQGGTDGRRDAETERAEVEDDGEGGAE